MNEKLQQANKLSEEITELEGFIKLAKEGAGANEYGKNKFGGLSISAYIWTGSDNPVYQKRIESDEAITVFVIAGIKELESLLEKKKIMLSNIFK